MVLELVEDAKGDYRNCRALAVASELAYLPESQGADQFRTQLALEARLLSVNNTQVYLANNDDHIVVAFRGTESPTSIDGLKDCLLTDAANLLIMPEGDLGTDFVAAGVGARVHLGFVRALADIWDPLLAGVEAERKKNDRPIWITGHSLGGALAQMAAWRFKRKFINTHQIYTFGAPMIGNPKAAEAFDQEFSDKNFRCVNFPDPVPKLPTISLIANHYCHCGKEILLGAQTAATDATISVVAFLEQMAGKTVNGVLNATLIDDIWQGLLQRVKAHFLDAYQKGIAELPHD
jgi:triacylglycerol lipase